MISSVKISEDGKRLLETLQAKLVISTGRKYSQQELLETIVRLSTEREDELIGLLIGVKLPFPPEEIETLMGLPLDWGVETVEEDIDKHLYGGGVTSSPREPNSEGPRR